MDSWQAVWLAIVQGLSEFLPISSSGHLILVPHLIGWPDQGLAFDVAVHVGTLAAVLAYFRAQLLRMAGAWFRSVQGQPANPDSRLAWLLLLATLPVGLAGLLFHDLIATLLRSPLFVAGTLSVFGLLMWVADAFGPRRRDEYALGWREALLIGLAQALSLMPGTSRSGVTMTMGRLLGLERAAAARFSFLLAVPGIAMAGLWELSQLLAGPRQGVDWAVMGLGVAVAAVTGYACIHVLLKVIERTGLWPFTVYRLLLAGVIVLVFS